MKLTLEEIEIQILFLSLPSTSLLKEIKTKDQWNFWCGLRKQNYLLYAFWLRRILESESVRTQGQPEILEKIRDVDKEINGFTIDKLSKEIIKKESDYFRELWELVKLLYRLFKKEVSVYRDDEFPASSLILFNEIVTVELNNRFKLVLKDKFEHSQCKHNLMLRLGVQHLAGLIELITENKLDSKLSKIEIKNFQTIFRNYRVVRHDSEYSNPSLEILYSVAIRELYRNKDIKRFFNIILENLAEQNKLRITLGERRKHGTRKREPSELWVNGVKKCGNSSGSYS